MNEHKNNDHQKSEKKLYDEFFIALYVYMHKKCIFTVLKLYKKK